MKHSHRRRKETELVDSDFAEALYGNRSEHFATRQAHRKAQQFCRQVQRALNLALADCCLDDSLAGLYVEEASPGPDCGLLLVHVHVPTGHAVADAIGALRRDAPRLRREVAMFIARKRAPELWFIPGLADGGSHE